jgi:hypothetical protein
MTGQGFGVDAYAVDVGGGAVRGTGMPRRQSLGRR